jgi:hypothetical protein
MKTVENLFGSFAGNMYLNQLGNMLSELPWEDEELIKATLDGLVLYAKEKRIGTTTISFIEWFDLICTICRSSPV